MIITDNKSIKKILLIKLRGIGDVILSSVVFDNLRKHFPDAQIDYLTEKPSNQILEPLHEINDVILFGKKELKDRIKLFLDIRKRKYDLILDFYSNPFTAQVTFFSGSKLRAGFPYKGRKYAYNLYGPAERGKYHAADLHLEFLKRIGIPVKSQQLKLGLTPHDMKLSEEYFSNTFTSEDFVVGISPSGGWSSKKCDPVKFAEIADEIIEKYNCKILLLWGPDDEKEADEIVNLMNHSAVKAPPTKIGELAAFIQKCDVLIANDSGPMHMSAAVDTPTLSLHGPTDPKLQGPYGDKHEYVLLEELNCIICNLLECPKHHECFLDLPVERVIKKFDSLVSKNGISNG